MPLSRILNTRHSLILSDGTLPVTTEPVTADWFSADFWQRRNELEKTARGRGKVWFIRSELGSWVLRHYRRGGLIAGIIQQQFVFRGLQRTRPWRELALLETMHESGLPVPKPVAGYVKRQYGCYQAGILTETLPRTQELFQLILQQQTIDWRATGQTIRQFHQAGIFHSDLNCHNILIDDREKVWLIDFDKCDQRPPAQYWQQNNLQRLHRSLQKEASAHPTFHFSTRHWQELLTGYEA